MVKRKRYLAVTLLMLAMAAAIGAVAYGVWSRSAVPVDGTQWSQPAQMPETTEPETAATAEPIQTEETEAPTEWEPREVFFGDRSFLSDAEEIDLSGMEIESAQWVEERIRDMPKLQKVIMCDCGLGDEEMDALNRRYEDIRFVWTVRMGRISVRTDTNYFAPVVTGDYVTEIDLGPLKYCTDVVAVDLGHMAVRTCDWARNMPKLQYLILADTGITDISPLASCENLIFLELFLTAVRDYSPLLSCTRLEDLNLCYSYGSAEPVKQMTWLKRLWWDGNPYETKGLEEYLPDTECNFTSGSSTGGTWRLGQRYKEQRDILGMPYCVG